MLLGKLFRPVRHDKEFRGLYSTRQFLQAMERERARAERWGTTLALLSLGVEPSPAGRATLLQVAKLLRRRHGVTDETGWLCDGQIGVLMPNAPPWQAWNLADDLCLALPEGVPMAECRVFAYPSRGRKTDLAQANESSPNLPQVEAMETLFLRPLPAWKRAVDIVGAVAALILSSPVLLLAALTVKLTSRGPVLFHQLRGGIGGRPFVMHKFRTMVVDAEQRKESLRTLNEQDGPAFKLRNDPRVTRVGAFLRKFSIDELPQLWNVLRGDMSLVGPRPLPCDESDACRGWHRQRLDVTPGLTCIWQVHGRGRVSFTEWIRMDLNYVRSRSPGRDLTLLLKTVWAVLFGRGT